MWHIPAKGDTTSRRHTNILTHMCPCEGYEGCVTKHIGTPPWGQLDLQETTLPPLSQPSLSNTVLLNVAPIIESMTSGLSTALNIATSHFSLKTLRFLKGRIHASVCWTAWPFKAMFQSFENLRDGVQSEIKLAIDNKSYLEKGSPPLKPVWMLLRKESWMWVPPA